MPARPVRLSHGLPVCRAFYHKEVHWLREYRNDFGSAIPLQITTAMARQGQAQVETLAASWWQDVQWIVCNLLGHYLFKAVAC